MAEEIILTEVQEDALREVGIIGMGNASIGFSELLDSKIDLDVPCVKLIKADELSTVVAEPKTLLTEIYSVVTEDIYATIVIIFKRNDAKILSEEVLKNILVREEPEILDGLGRDAVKEVCNILIGSYLTALSKFLGISIYHHVPVIIFGLGERPAMGVPKSIRKEAEYALILKTDFLVEKKRIEGKMVFLIDTKSLRVLIGRLDEKIAQ